jgi:hypothetical protein
MCIWAAVSGLAAATIMVPVRGPHEAGADALSMTGPMPMYEQLVRQWLGASGNLRAVMASDDQSWLGPWLKTAGITSTPGLPGVHLLKWTAPDGLPMVLLQLVPFEVKDGAFVGPYHLGRWPAERHPATAPNPLPPGFIVVTPDNQDTYVSTRFRLRDFVTHDQDGVWPKYLVLRTELLDKLELIAQELEKEGRPARLEVLSGFRSPQYNAQGVGRRRGGRARDSQHMYGDAADIYVDADGDGRMDDLDGDGRVTVSDARMLLAIAERVEGSHPDLIGGLAAYRPTGAHGPFVHVDARGWRARW